MITQVSANQYHAYAIPAASIEAPQRSGGENWTIPVVYMSDFFDPEKRDAFIKQFVDGMHEIGFVAVVPTDEDLETLQTGFETAQQFFDRTDEEKNEIAMADPTGRRGYCSADVSGKWTFKMKEWLHIGTDNNRWPSSMDLQNPTEKLFDMLTRSSEELQKVFAIGLGKEENFFISQTEGGKKLARIVHYDYNKTPNDPRSWAPKGEDPGLFTIEILDSGLKVFPKEGGYIDIRAPENAFLVHPGTDLSRISDGYYISPVHEVASVPGQDCISLVYFTPLK